MAGGKKARNRGDRGDRRNKARTRSTGGVRRLWQSGKAGKVLLAGSGTVLCGALATVVGTALTNLTGMNDEPTVVVAGTSATPESGPALRVTGVRHVTRQLDYTWVHPREVDQATVDRLNAEIEGAGGLRTEGADEAMRAAGAVEATMQTVEVDVEGNRNAAVKIVNIHVEKQCREPLRGTAFLAPPQGATDTVQLGFELDTPQPVAKKVKPDPNDGPPHFTTDYFAGQKYDLARDEQVTFRLSARSFKQHCTYRYRFELDGDSGPPVLVPAKGRPPLEVSAEVKDGDPRRGLTSCPAYGRRYASDTFSRSATAPAPWLSAKDANIPCSG